MAVAAEGLKITFEEEFYERLCLDKQVEVRFLDHHKGKCLLAKVPFVEDEVVLSERKCVAAQNLDDLVACIRVCGNCLKSLETVAGTCGRVRRIVAAARSKQRPLPKFHEESLPYVYSLPTGPVPVLCTYAETHGCEEQFCCTECREEAWSRYHAVLCPGTSGIPMGPHNPVSKFKAESWVQGGVNYADTFFVSFIILSHVMCDIRLNSCSPEEAWLPFSFFISVPWELLSFDYLLSDDEEEGADEEDRRTREEVVLHALECLVEERTPPSHLVEYRTFLADHHPDVDQDALVRSIVGPRASDEEKDLLNYSTKGQGIYIVGACMNHSCTPNVYVSYTKNNDEELVVMASRDIRAGEELCISYIDEDMDVATRQTHLWHHYRFHCRCPKCTKELAAAVSPPEGMPVAAGSTDTAPPSVQDTGPLCVSSAQADPGPSA
eukprot:GGOE01018534.1.p1 GENE.GGOE01018534.1~~GGOE01018534.1.p1  ORF type:complete len:437 (+),score=115.10 GGOE01018534.1:66-1376(+)